MTTATSWDTFNAFLLNGALDRFTKILARYELFKQVIDLPGDIVEGGVFKGAGILYWAKLLQIYNPLSPRKVIGFDTFGGYSPSTNEQDLRMGQEFIADANYTSVSPEAIMSIAASQGLDHRIELIKGDATVSIKDYVDNNPGFRIALLNLDFDVYEPTTAALQHLYPLIVPNGVIIFDEYAKKGWGESDAVDEFFKDKPYPYRAIPWALSPTAYLIKER